jgi:hypothetical protein
MLPDVKAQIYVNIYQLLICEQALKPEKISTDLEALVIKAR